MNGVPRAQLPLNGRQGIIVLELAPPVTVSLASQTADMLLRSEFGCISAVLSYGKPLRLPPGRYLVSDDGMEAESAVIEIVGHACEIGRTAGTLQVRKGG
ncbi:MAG: hypothetical protein RLZ55_550 [Actinomycetota bacterium]